MIKPTIGRVVWFFDKNRQYDNQPLDAHICYVHSDTMINIGGFDSNGHPFSQTSVFLRADNSVSVAGQSLWCEWMPYQAAQAKKNEEETK